MTQDSTWPVPLLASALGVPDEAFRAFVHLNGLGWDARIDVTQAAKLAIAWQDATGGSATGPVGDAVNALFAAIATSLTPPADAGAPSV